MTNLFFRIRPDRHEDASTEILAFLLQEYPECRNAFLSLVNSASTDGEYAVKTQHVINGGRPDMLIQSDQEIVFIENKPHDYSSFTDGNAEKDQLKRYSEALKSSVVESKKLVLLATEDNKESLLLEAANAEGVSADEKSLFAHYDKEGIKFSLVTWERVLDALDASQIVDPIFRFLLDQLRGFVIVPVRKIPKEVYLEEETIRKSWIQIKEDVKNVKCLIAKRLKPGDYTYNHSCSQSMTDFYGYFIRDNKTHITYWFGVDLATWRYFKTVGKNSAYGVRVCFLHEQNTFVNSSEGRPIIDPKILLECGFEYDSTPQAGGIPEREYVFSLADSSDGNEITNKELADSFVSIITRVNEKLVSSKTGNNS